jgi:hypothetical protein
MTTSILRSAQRIFRHALLAACVAAATILAGCGYTLRGKVVRGDVSSVEIVHEIDPRMKAAGLANAEVLVHRDPKTLNRRLVGRDYTDASGRFTMHLGEFGAGWMEEQWLVQSWLTGYQNAEALTKLPSKGSKWMLLVTLAPGQSVPVQTQDDFMRDYERFK